MNISIQIDILIIGIGLSKAGTAISVVDAWKNVLISIKISKLKVEYALCPGEIVYSTELVKLSLPCLSSPLFIGRY